MSATLLGAVLVAAPAVAAGPPSPTGGSADASSDGTVHFEWSASPGASAYRLEWSADPSFPSGSTTQIDTYALDYVTRYQPAVGGDADLYWRVSAFATGTTVSSLGEPSPSNVVTTGVEAAPVPIGPGSDGVTAQLAYPQSTVFSWEPVAGAISYQLEYTSDTLGSGTTPVTVAGTQYAPPNPLARVDSNGNALTWKWRVRAQMYNGTTSASTGVVYGAWSPDREFQITWDQAPTNLYPADAVDPFYSDMEFSWDAVPGAAKYRVTFGNSVEGDGATRRILNPLTRDVYTTTYIPTAQASDATRYWQVTPLDYAGNPGAASAVHQYRKKWGTQHDASAPFTSEDAAPVSITGSTDEAAPTAIYLSDLELEWEPIARATFYEVEVRDGLGNLFVCRTASTSATIVGFYEDGADNLGNSAVLRGAGECLWNDTPAKRIQAGRSYNWRVRAVDYTGSLSTTYQAASVPAGVQLSSWSALRYLSIKTEDRTPPTQGLVDLDLEAFTVDNPAADAGQPAPRMKWSAAGDGGFAPGYEVVLFKNPQRTAEIARFVTPSTRLRLNGVLSDNTTTDPYYASVKPIVPANDSWSDYAVLGSLANESTESFVWQKASQALTGLATTTLSDGSVRLSWNPQSVTGMRDGGSRGYQVRILNGNTQLGVVKKVEYPFYMAQSPAVSNDTSFPSTMTDVPLPPGNNYSFEVAPLDANGNPGRVTRSSTFSVGIATPAVTAPATVAGGTATLRWSTVPGALKYSVQYRVAGTATWTSLANIAQTAATLPSLAQGNYEWQVRTHDASNLSSNVSAWSATQTFSVGSAASAISMTDAITLSLDDRVLRWSSSVDGATRYQVQIAEDSKFSTGVKSYETVATSLAIPDAVSSVKQYYWQVKALAEPVGASSALRVLAVSATDPFTVLTAPAKVAGLSVVRAGTGLTAAWTQLSGANAGTSESLSYIVAFREKSTDSDWTAATEQETSAGANTFTVAPLATGTVYEFRVAGKNSEGIGPWSDVKELATATAPTVAPTLSITPKLGELSLRIGSLSSTGNGGSAVTGYHLEYRRAADAEWTTHDIPVTSTYALTGLGSATDYVVSVAAINAVGVGPATVVSSLTLGLSSAPTSVKAVRGDKSATASWAAPTVPNGTVTSYVVEKRIGTTGTWASAGTVSATTTKLTLTGLVNGKAYQVRVAAKTSVGVGAYSTPVKVVPAGKPFAPTTVKATSSTAGLLTVTWNKGLGNGSPITAYTVQFSTDGKRFTTIKKVGASTLKLTTTKGTRGKTVYFRVFSHNALGKSVASTTVSVVRR